MPAALGLTPLIGSLSALLFGTMVLTLGQGLFLLLIPLKLDEAGFSTVAVSAVVSSYFAGFVIGAWFCDRVIRSIGHIRAYGGLIAIVIAVVLTLPLWPSVIAWAVLRFIHGVAVSGVFLAIESWLNTATPNLWRGRVLGLYTLLSLAALGSGQLLINLYGTEGFEPFSLGAIVFALSIVPVVLSRIVAPVVTTAAKRSQRELFGHTPLGVLGSFASGLNTGAFWALAPLFGLATGLDATGITIMMAVTVFGGLILEWPIGYLSDRFDRRSIILAVACVGTAASITIALAHEQSHVVLFGSIFVYGGVSFALYPLALSHAADHLPEAEDMLGMSRGLLLSNGLGLAIGPLAGGQVVHLLGREGLFIFATVVIGSVALVTGWRTLRKAKVPLEEQGSYVPVYESTPAILALDPRHQSPQQELPLQPPEQQTPETAGEASSPDKIDKP